MSIDISPDTVSRLIATQFPDWSDLPVRPVAVDGRNNRTFHLGETMSVRLPSAESYAPQVLKEYEWLPKLAPELPLQIPTPIALGEPSADYPWHWSVNRWIEGEMASPDRIDDPSEAAVMLADFLRAFHKIDASNGPPPGPHNFVRGGPLATYGGDVDRALAKLASLVDESAVRALWSAALDTEWTRPPVWLHGDFYPKNLLVRDGRLCAVIDFGLTGVGDPACDMAIAWTLFDAEHRELFRSRLALDDATWLRGMGWVMWKELITCEECVEEGKDTERSLGIIADLLRDHRR